MARREWPEPDSTWRRFGRFGVWLLLGAVAFLCHNSGVPRSESAGSADWPAKKLVRITSRCEGDVTRFFVENLELADVTVSFNFDLANMKSTVTFPYTATFPPQRTTEAFSLSPLSQDALWHYSFTNHYNLGSSCAVHDDSFLYSLPYAPGRAFRVTQGDDGRFSHQGSNRHAIDWGMPVGTPVHAARGGRVVKIKNDSTCGGPDVRFDCYNNYVLIRHDDGTLGQYCHLLKNSIKVREGDTVENTQLIALSGNTGFSSGPHLHFSVYRTRNGRERESIPVKFRSINATPITLKAGDRYTAARMAPDSTPLKKSSHEPVGI